MTELPAGLDTGGTIVSGDALHTQRPTAHYLLEQAGAHYLLQVKGDQLLHTRTKGLRWDQVPRCCAKSTVCAPPTGPPSKP
ncbi:hypothetical protein [Nocardiopsis kunsanensis]|uniref:hypothetical protein n=1 Tax=Nocardiopsis kunsanensis TaxID=141693 RepID=UPI000348C899|nr:hypothetical protein [Nocardiopsis kunsanensis]